MSFMRGNFLAKTQKLVKGLAISEPVWLKAMEQAPPPTFPRAQNKLKQIILPEDTYISTFYQKHPDAKFEDPIKISSFAPPAARQFAWRVLELKEEGVDDADAITVADNEYMAERRAKKKAFARLKQIRKLQGRRRLPPNPYPSAVKEIQAEERQLVRDRFFNPQTREIVERLRSERAAMLSDRERERR